MPSEKLAHEDSHQSLNSGALDNTITELDNATLNQYRVIRRNGQLTCFDLNKIAAAMTNAFLAVEGDTANASNRIQNAVQALTKQVIKGISRRLREEGTVHIEDIQDQVELALMRAGFHKVARAYVLYREEHAHLRAEKPETKVIHITDNAGRRLILDESCLQAQATEACANLEGVTSALVIEESLKNLFDGISERDVNHALVMSTRMLIEKEPNYTYVAARLLLNQLRKEALAFVKFNPVLATAADMVRYYPDYFKVYIHCGIEHELLDPTLAKFDLARLGNALVAERDLQFTYLGLQTLYDRYFLHWEDTRFELPQAFFMRVAMGLALNEDDREARAIEFYNLLSCFDFMSSTPTLFNSGTKRPQLSSCYLTTVPDDLEGIYDAIKDNALLSKFAGGLGNDWTPVRGMGSHIKGTNGKSQGVVPFLKVANDTLVAVNQGGRRRGSGCAYLETWHIDIEEFLELRKNTGDERRRTHDMNTANWIPDLFLERVQENAQWTLFSPNEVPDLHELYGDAFKKAYETHEAAAEQGNLKIWKPVSAVGLWRKMLTMLFETGHPWLTFKDACNLRSPQQHVGVVHSSNLCCEITLNTKAGDEVAVCNLASINLPAHIKDGKLDTEKLQRTVRTAMRALDNVIDINYYSVPQARTANQRHRPIGLGLMGFQDALYKLRIPYASQAAVEFADYAQEVISYYAISASTDLAEERGRYASFEGSLWSQGILPIDSIQKLAEARGKYLEMSTTATLDWDSLRERVKTVGMRNSNTMAIAPTACVARDTLILSSEGLVPIETLSVSTGQWQTINMQVMQESNLALSNQLYLNGLTDTLRVVTKRGSNLTATPNHRIRVVGDNGEYAWKFLSELRVGDEVIRRLGGHQELLANKPYLVLQIPQKTNTINQKKVGLPTELTEEVAYLLGLYMGDGYLKYSERGHYTKKDGIGIAICDDDAAIVEFVQQVFNKMGITVLADTSKKNSGCTVYFAYSTALVDWFESNDFTKSKGNFGDGSASAFIPQAVLQSRTNVLAAFISGLFVADGTVSDCHTEFATVSEILAHQVKVSLESMDIVTTLSLSQPETLGKRPVYRVRPSNVLATQQFSETVGFGVSRKDAKLKETLAKCVSEPNMRREHHVENPALIVDFIAAARKCGINEPLLNGVVCSKTNGALNIHLARRVIAEYPDMANTQLGLILSKGNVYFEKIVDIIPSRDMTYDLQVPEYNTYIANGFVSHNTISNICGVTQSIEPTYQNLYVKSNLSGEFTIINPYLVQDIKALGLWDEVMINDLKYCDGSIRLIDRIPEEIKRLYATAFEIDPSWLVEAASRRQKWIDQAQSLNLYLLEPSGRKLDDLYQLAWMRGLKTTYYMRTMGATRVEKSTAINPQLNAESTPQACALDDSEECEACQ
ncbi:MAG TPA: ribonucleoside-diphosphate reductase subunit alpha [Thioploca sp.]|nr:ribonucleoside-diphosphate reductase subunit alpha [Thioploca sp.]